jgi:predicted ArsR family transcriptional regulator
MSKEHYHPNAYLRDFRNVRMGLRTRTVILELLEGASASAREIADKTGLRYSVVLHHLKLLESKGIVKRKSGKPSIWVLTGLGQRRLG